MSKLFESASMKRLAVFAVAAVLAMATLFGCSSNSNDKKDADKGGAPAAEQVHQIELKMSITDLEGAVLFDQFVTTADGASVMEVLQDSGVEYKSKDSDYGPYVTEIAGQASTNTTGWVFTINDEEVMVGADQATITTGDTIAWKLISF